MHVIHSFWFFRCENIGKLLVKKRILLQIWLFLVFVLVIYCDKIQLNLNIWLTDCFWFSILGASHLISSSNPHQITNQTDFEGRRHQNSSITLRRSLTDSLVSSMLLLQPQQVSLLKSIYNLIALRVLKKNSERTYKLIISLI